MISFLSIPNSSQIVNTLLLTFILILGGCGSDLDNDDSASDSSDNGSTQNDGGETDSAFFDADGAAVQVLDATGNDTWVYFDLDTFSVVSPANPDADTTWDIAFQRFKVKLNGGISGIGAVDVSALHDTALLSVTTAPSGGFVTDRYLLDLSDQELLALGSNIFFSVCASGYDDEESPQYCLAEDVVNRERLNQEEAAYAFLTQGSGAAIEENGEDGDPILGWYDYFMYENHILRPAADTWVVRSTDGTEFALQMLGYYGYEEGDAESGTIAFRYVSITPDKDIPQPGAQQLSVSITASTISGQGPLTVAFEGAAAGAEGSSVWNWDFGDGTSGVGQMVEHTYDSVGTFTATLSVTDDRGEAGAANNSVIITVAGASGIAPVADAGEDMEVDLGDGESQIAVSLDGSGSTDSDGQIESYEWVGSPTPDNVVNPSVLLAVGSYTFRLTVTDDDGLSGSDTVQVRVNGADNEAPTAKITVDTSSGLVPLTSRFDGSTSSDLDGSIVSWEWDFGDGSAASFEADPIHEFTEAGIFTVTLTVTDDAGDTATTSLLVETSLRVPTLQDTYVYEFLGNQGSPSGDSGGLLIWNHISNHGAKALISFANNWLGAQVLASGFTATLHLYAADGLGDDDSGFVGANPGDEDLDNPFTPGVATVKVDILPQPGSWVEGGTIAWASVAESGTSVATLTQSQVSRWYSVDITAIVQGWVDGGTVGGGLSLSQEAYPVLRAENGAIPVATFCDRESAQPACAAGSLGFDAAPYIEIKALP